MGRPRISTNCWVWSLIIFLVFRCLVQPVLDPIPQRGGCGGSFPPTIVAGESRGGGQVMSTPPLVGVWGQRPRKDFFYEKCLVKYFDFVVNLEHSLCRRFDGRSYVNIRVFFPRRKPSIIYEGIVLWLCVILRDETVRE